MLTHARLLEVLHYHPESGDFVWLQRTRSRTEIGTQAGTIMKRGYWKISIEGEQFYGHRLAWFYTHKEWPKENIDHKNRNRIDNRIGNLRECSVANNAKNMRREKANTSGYKGVYWHKSAQKYAASIRLDYKNKHLGVFETPEDAYAAYVEAAKKLHGEYCSE